MEGGDAEVSPPVTLLCVTGVYTRLCPRRCKVVWLGASVTPPPPYSETSAGVAAALSISLALSGVMSEEPRLTVALAVMLEGLPVRVRSLSVTTERANARFCGGMSCSLSWKASSVSLTMCFILPVTSLRNSSSDIPAHSRSSFVAFVLESLPSPASTSSWTPTCLVACLVATFAATESSSACFCPSGALLRWAELAGVAFWNPDVYFIKYDFLHKGVDLRGQGGFVGRRVSVEASVGLWCRRRTPDGPELVSHETPGVRYFMKTPKKWFKASASKRKAMMRKICRYHRHHFVGDFFLCDGAVMRKPGSVLMHLPSGRWKGLTLDLESSKDKLIAMTPEEQQDTVVWLHECV